MVKLHGMVRTVISLILVLMMFTSQAQLSISNGVGLPSRDTLRILIVFAEVDFEDGPCQSGMTETFKGSWGRDQDGNYKVPDFAGEFLDVEIESDGPKGEITKVFHEASFGQYVMVGDFLPQIVTVPCNDIRPRNNGVAQVLGILDTWMDQDSTLYSNSGLPLNAFDQWSNMKRGEPKVKEPDGRIDLLYIMWRNNRMLTGKNTMSSAGYGVALNGGKAFKNMKGLNNMASFNAADGVGAGKFITIAEHLHGIYGGNHWHSAAGAGTHTFLCRPHNYGLTGQSGSTSQMVSGWDRWMQRWKHPEKQMLISALDTLGNEINTETVNINDNENGVSVVLRDFSSTGDVVRIKLPYVSDDSLVKNQYLWLENHQFKMSTDVYLQYDCSNNMNGKFSKGTPGVYAYIQVGKDQREGSSEIYNARHHQPNGLASPIFPLTAEGNFDMHYRYDLVPEPVNLGCFWNNSSIPVEREKSKPNPFTGHNDLAAMVDSDKDGKLYSGDRMQLGFTDLINDSLVHNFYTNGDWKDPFAKITGNTTMAIYTNPAPTPRYTLASNYQYKKFGFKDGEFGSFENRTIWLNGLKLNFTELENGSVNVDIAWDEFEVKEDVRWCGNIVLSPNHVNSTQPSLILNKCKEISLDRGESATVHEAYGKSESGEWLFAEATVFTIKSGSIMKMEKQSTLRIQKDSKMVIEAGATLIMDKKSKIFLAPGAELVIEEGANLIQSSKSKIIKR